MALSPPCPPLPKTWLSTAGSTDASNWPSAPLKAGEFSNESRIPMIEPLWVDGEEGHADSDRFVWSGQASNQLHRADRRRRNRSQIHYMRKENMRKESGIAY